jgi:hypothetical protein
VTNCKHSQYRYSGSPDNEEEDENNEHEHHYENGYNQVSSTS